MAFLRREWRALGALVGVFSVLLPLLGFLQHAVRTIDAMAETPATVATGLQVTADRLESLRLTMLSHATESAAVGRLEVLYLCQLASTNQRDRDACGRRAAVDQPVPP